MCVVLDKAMLKKPRTLWVDVSLLLVNIIHMCTCTFLYIFMYMYVHVCTCIDTVHMYCMYMCIEVGRSD